MSIHLLSVGARSARAVVNPVHLGTQITGKNDGTESTFAATNPAYSAGDLVIVCVRIDHGSNVTINAPTVTGETLVQEVAPFDNTDIGAGGTSMGIWRYIAANSLASGANVNCSFSAAEQCVVSVSVFDAGTFATTSPITNEATGFSATEVTPIPSPATTATNAGGMVLAFFGIDIDTITGTPAGWTQLQTPLDVGAIAGAVAKRDAFTTASESVASANFTPAAARKYVAATCVINPG